MNKTAADVSYACELCNQEFQDEVAARAHTATIPGHIIEVYQDGQWTGQALAKKAALQASCERCGLSASISPEAGTPVTVIGNDGQFPGVMTPEGWVVAGAGGASADMEYCPACSKGLVHDPGTCEDAQCSICAEIDPHMTEHGIGPKKADDGSGTPMSDSLETVLDYIRSLAENFANYRDNQEGISSKESAWMYYYMAQAADMGASDQQILDAASAYPEGAAFSLDHSKNFRQGGQFYDSRKRWEDAGAFSWVKRADGAGSEMMDDLIQQVAAALSEDKRAQFLAMPRAKQVLFVNKAMDMGIIQWKIGKKAAAESYEGEEGHRQHLREVVKGTYLEPAVESALSELDAFSVAAGLYHFLADYHGGMSSEEYRMLSALDYTPGMGEISPGSENFEVHPSGEGESDAAAYQMFESAFEGLGKAKAASVKKVAVQGMWRGQEVGSNATFKVTEPTQVWVTSGSKPTNEWYGNSQFYKSTYEEQTLEPGDDVQLLHGGLFAKGMSLKNIRFEPPEDKSIFEKSYGPTYYLLPDTLELVSNEGWGSGVKAQAASGNALLMMEMAQARFGKPVEELTYEELSELRQALAEPAQQPVYQIAKKAGEESSTGRLGENRDKFEACSQCGFVFDLAVDYDKKGKCPDCAERYMRAWSGDSLKHAESGNVEEAEPDVVPVAGDEPSGEVKEFSRVERASTGEKGIVLKVNDQKPGDIDVLVYWDVPHAGYQIFETDIGDIVPIDEEPSPEDIEKAKQVRDKYDVDKKAYEESFKDKVKSDAKGGDEDELVEREGEDLEEKQRALQKDLQPATTAALLRIGVGPETPPPFNQGELVDQATEGKVHFELRRYDTGGEPQYWVFARMVGRAPVDESDAAEFEAKKKGEPDDWRNMGSNPNIESQWRERANLKHWAGDLYVDLLGLDPVEGCFKPIEDETTQRVLAKVVLFDREGIDQRLVELEGPLAAKWAASNHVAEGFDFYQKGERFIAWGTNESYNPDKIEAEVPDGMWATIPGHHAQKLMVEKMAQMVEPAYQEIMLRSKARSILAGAIVKRAQEELERHDKINLETRKEPAETTPLKPSLKVAAVTDAEQRLMDFLTELKTSQPDLYAQVDAAWQTYIGDVSSTSPEQVPAVGPASGQELSQQMGGGQGAEEGIMEKGAVVKEATTNSEVIDMFLNDSFPKDKKPVWGTTNVKIMKEDNGWSLVNYQTPIMYRSNEGQLYLNTDHYSQTTTRLQNYMRSQAGGAQEVDEAGIRSAMEEAGGEQVPDVQPAGGEELMDRPENKPTMAESIKSLRETGGGFALEGLMDCQACGTTGDGPNGEQCSVCGGAGLLPEGQTGQPVAEDPVMRETNKLAARTKMECMECGHKFSADPNGDPECPKCHGSDVDLA